MSGLSNKRQSYVFYSMRIALIIGFCLFCISCVTLQNEKSPESPFDLIISLDKNVYRPGEMVICTAYLYNRSDESYFIQAMDAQSLTFWVSPQMEDNVYRIEPIFSKLEPLGDKIEVEAKGSIQRPFVFTMMTQAPNDLRVQAIYQIQPTILEDKLPDVVSKPVEFSVAGERLFERDEDGILTKANAIKIAQEKVGEALGSDAMLVLNEAGFLDWWINLTVDVNREGEEVKKAYLINPYRGRVRKEVVPFERKAEPEQPPASRIKQKVLKDKLIPRKGTAPVK